MPDPRFYVRREKASTGRFREDVAYLSLLNGRFIWLLTDDHDTWDDCMREATEFTEFEAAILLMNFNQQDSQRLYFHEAFPIHGK